MRHIFGCGIFAYPQFILDLGVPLPWFFVITGLFTVNYIDIVIFECYPGWLPSEKCWPSMGYFSSCPGGSPGFCFCGAWQVLLLLQNSFVCLWDCFEVWGNILESSQFFRSRRPFIIRGSFKKVCDVYHIIIHVWFQIFQSTHLSRIRGA